MTGTLIVGAGQAGIQIAATLREGGYDEPVLVIGEEAHQPYQRPPLSKEFLRGQADIAGLELRSPSYYAENQIEVVPSDAVTELELSGPPGSGTARTASGRQIAFDRLALATGSAPRRLSIPGSNVEGIFYLRVLDDAVLLRGALETAENVVVIGGGFIGLEAAGVAREAGKRVTVLEAADRLVERSVAPVMSDFILAAHLRRGTDVRLGAQAAALVGRAGKVAAVQLADGEQIPADIVIVGIGVMARTDLAERIGIRCDRGIVVDEFAQTSSPGVVAAGDCTVQPNPLTGEGLFRLESIQNASHQARVAASTLLGNPEAHRTVPWFWSDQYDLKLQIAGLSAGYDDIVLRGNPDSEAFSVIYYRDGALLSIDTINQTADYFAVRAALAGGLHIPAARAADVTVSLKALTQQAASPKVKL